MTMTPRLRKLALTAHVTSSVGWLGAVAGFLAVAVVGLTSRDAQTVRGAYLVMEPAAWFVLVPFAFASLVSGLVQSLGTTWGLFRHYWVLFKLLINAVAPPRRLAAEAFGCGQPGKLAGFALVAVAECGPERVL